MRTRSLAIATTLALVLGLGPAGATTPGDVPVVTSDNVELVNTFPEAGAAISMEFASDEPVAYVSTLKGLHTYDVSDPEAPERLGYLPFALYQNENMALGERPDTGEKFVTLASDLAAVTAAGDDNVGGNYVVIVEVTDPANPEIVARVETDTRTHTVTCDSPRCDYLYSDGRPQGEMSIVDLTDFREPQMATTFASVVPRGHDADVDAEGILWHVGGEGSVALDISDPTAPVELASTNNLALEGRPWNVFIHHNSLRPHADAFTHTEDEDGRLHSGEADIRNGNVLLVTEESSSTTSSGTRCGEGQEGAFQTWHVDYLDADQYAADNPDRRSGGGTMEPLDRWNTELLDTGDPQDFGTRCSAHYFDYHQDGFVAQGWYGQGMRILDVRDAADIKQAGYFLTGAQSVWSAYWLPAYDEDGVDTGERSSYVYTADAVRGMDVLRVDLPDDDPADTEDLTAPILPEWRDGDVTDGLYEPDPDFGSACLIPTEAAAELDNALPDAVRPGGLP